MKNLTKKYPFFNEFRYFKLYKVFKFRVKPPPGLLPHGYITPPILIYEKNYND